MEDKNYFKVDRGRIRANLVSELWVGGGNTTFRANREGVFAGASNYTNAPFKVSYAGVLSATGASISGTLTATGGSITGDLNVTGSLSSGDDSGRTIKIGSGKISIRNNDIELGYLKLDSSKSNFQIATGGKFYITKLNSGPTMTVNQDSSVEFATDSYIKWASGRKITATASQIQIDGALGATGTISTGGEIEAHSTLKFSSDGYIRWGGGRSITATSSAIEIDGDLVPNSDHGDDCGSSSKRWHNIRGQYIIADSYFKGAYRDEDGREGVWKDTHKYITDCYWSDDSIKVKERYLKFAGGIIISISSENTRTVHKF